MTVVPVFVIVEPARIAKLARSSACASDELKTTAEESETVAAANIVLGRIIIVFPFAVHI
jgi:hypothetical protein